MGIKNLHRFLRKHSDSSYNEVGLSHYANKSLAIDINVYLYRYKSIHKDKWLNVFLTLILTLHKYNIRCVFIYDTKAPVEKNAKKEERKKRKKNAENRINEINVAMVAFENTGTVPRILADISEKRGTKMKKLLKFDTSDSLDREAISEELTCLSNQIVNISRAEMLLSKQLLTLLGVPFYDSDNEAETMCAYLCCHGRVDAVLSDDTDVLVYGTPFFATKLNLKNETLTELRFPSILENLNFTHEQFTDLCIMCGTDYNDNVSQIGSEKAFKLLQKHVDLEGIETDRPDLDLSVLNFRRIREIFSMPLVIQDYSLEYKQVQKEEFEIFAVRHNLLLNQSRREIVFKLCLDI